MVRWLYILGICAMLAAFAVSGLWLSERSRGEAQLEEIRNRSGAVQVFRAQGSESGVRPAEVPALVEQAEGYARLLDPPRKAEKVTVPVVTASPASPVPAVRPAAPLAMFRLDGISYHRSKPEQSMALVWEPGGGRRWVRQGARLGHFVIHEIHAGMIVYRAGEQLREMAIERGTTSASLVRRHAGGVAQANYE